MTLRDGHGYLRGRLGRDWETKTINTKKGETVVRSTSLAYQPDKDGETTWVSLTVWPAKDGSQALPEAIAAESGKGTPVIVHGIMSTYRRKDGDDAWQMSVWDVAKTILPAKTQKRSGSPEPQRVVYDDEEPF